MRHTIAIAFAGTLAALAAQASADDLVYQPLSPSFGGDPFIGSFLLESANIQNQHRPEFRASQRTPVDVFRDSVQRSILARVSQQITESIFGEDPQESGNFLVGDLQVDFARVGEDVEIRLVDLTTGGETELTIPAPRF